MAAAAAAASLESSYPHTQNKESARLTDSSPMLSPSSDKRFLRNRVDTLLDNQKPVDQALPPIQSNAGGMDRAKRMKEDSMLLLRGFDSVSNSLSHLSSNLESALEGARDLAMPPTLSEIVHNTLEKAKSVKEQSKYEQEGEKNEEEAEEGNRGLKRKMDSQESPEDAGKENGEESPKELGKLKKATNIAISMAKRTEINELRFMFYARALRFS